MSQSAHVTSIDALRTFKESLCDFSLKAQEALCTADLEIRRTFDWLQAQLQAWQREVRHRQDEVTRARAELARARWGHHDGGGPGTTDQEIALRKAQARLKEAEGKVLTVRRWQQQLPQAVTEYEGPARRLSGWLDSDLRHAIVVLDQRIAALEAYLQLTPAESDPRPAVSPQPETESPPSSSG